MLRKEMKIFSSLKETLKEFKEQFEEADMGLIRVGINRFATCMFYAHSRLPQKSKELRRETRTGPYIERFAIDLSRTAMLLGLKSLLDSVYMRFVERGWNSISYALRNEFMNVNVKAINKDFQGIFRKHKFWLVEYFVEEEHLEDLIDLFRKLYKKTFVFNASLRFVPRYTNSYTAYAKTDVFALVICWDQLITDTAIAEAEKINQKFFDFLYERQGMFYLPYRNGPENIKKFYGEFVEHAKKSSAVFSNKMIEGLL